MKNRRKIFLIDSSFQLKFVFYVSSWTLALSMAFPLMIHQLFEFFRRFALVDPMAAPVALIYQTEKQIIWLLILGQVLFLCVISFVSFFMSHRIAGPLYKLRRFVERLRSGQLIEELNFRQTDYFPELADGFNSMFRETQKRLAMESEKKSHAAQSLQKIIDDLPSDDREILSRAIALLQNPVAHP